MRGLKILGITFTNTDRKFMNVLAPVIWAFMAADTVISFTSGRIGSGLISLGVLMVLFCGLIGPAMMRIVDPEKDVQLGKLLSIVTLLGFLIAATGVAYRLMMLMAPS